MLLQIVTFSIGLFCAVNSYGFSTTGSGSFSGGSSGGYGGGMSGSGGYGGSYRSEGILSKPKPHSFNYHANGMGASSFRNEQGDSSGNVQGSYGYSDVQGLHRQVQNTAGANGFRATVKTNEPGTDRKPESPADVNMMAGPAPAEIREKYTRRGTDSKPKSPADENAVAEPASAGTQENYTSRAGSGAYERNVGGRGIGGARGGVYGGKGMGGDDGMEEIGGVSSGLPARISRSGLEKIESEYQRGNVGLMRAYGENGMGDLRNGMGGYGGIRGEGMRVGHAGMGAFGDGTYGPSTGSSRSGSEKTLFGDQRGNVSGMRGLVGSRMVEYSGLGGGMDQHGGMGMVGDGSPSLFSGISRSGSGKTGTRGLGENVYGMGRYGGTGMAEYGGLEDGIRRNGEIRRGMGRNGDMVGVSDGSSSLFKGISRSGSGKSIL